MKYKIKSNHPSFSDYRKKIIDGQTTITEILENSLSKIQELNPSIRAFVTTDTKNLYQQAIASDRRYKEGNTLSVLDGCPIGIKDMINTKDLPTQMNSPIYKNWHAPMDAACVNALISAGLIVIGKTVTTSFAVGHTNETTNPYDINRTPGGSSSGSGASVGAGMVPIAIGTQTRGSLLRPASFCGSVGFKPTHNSIHLGGVHPLSPTLDHLGVISNSISDAFNCVKIMTKTRSSFSGHNSLQKNLSNSDIMPIKNLAILEFNEWHSAGKETETEFNKIVKTLSSAGCKIFSTDNDATLKIIENDLINIIDTESLDILAYEMDWPFNSYPREQLDGRILDLLEKGESISFNDYHILLKKRIKIREKINSLCKKYDAFLSLSSTGPAPFGNENTGSRHYQVPWTYLGFPAFSLPLLIVEGMPVGIQLMGFKNQDEILGKQAQWISKFFI